ncbi:MAG: hypothetical protein SGPRY_009275 [Prymnesium sp.]
MPMKPSTPLARATPRVSKPLKPDGSAPASSNTHTVPPSKRPLTSQARTPKPMPYSTRSFSQAERAAAILWMGRRREAEVEGRRAVKRPIPAPGSRERRASPTWQAEGLMDGLRREDVEVGSERRGEKRGGEWQDSNSIGVYPSRSASAYPQSRAERGAGVVIGWDGERVGVEGRRCGKGGGRGRGVARDEVRIGRAVRLGGAQMRQEQRPRDPMSACCERVAPRATAGGEARRQPSLPKEQGMEGRAAPRTACRLLRKVVFGDDSPHPDVNRGAVDRTLALVDQLSAMDASTWLQTEAGEQAPASPPLSFVSQAPSGEFGYPSHRLRHALDDVSDARMEMSQIDARRMEHVRALALELRQRIGEAACSSQHLPQNAARCREHEEGQSCALSESHTSRSSSLEDVHRGDRCADTMDLAISEDSAIHEESTTLEGLAIREEPPTVVQGETTAAQCAAIEIDPPSLACAAWVDSPQADAWARAFWSQVGVEGPEWSGQVNTGFEAMGAHPGSRTAQVGPPAVMGGASVVQTGEAPAANMGQLPPAAPENPWVFSTLQDSPLFGRACNSTSQARDSFEEANKEEVAPEKDEAEAEVDEADAEAEECSSSESEEDEGSEESSEEKEGDGGEESILDEENCEQEEGGEEERHDVLHNKLDLEDPMSDDSGLAETCVPVLPHTELAIGDQAPQLALPGACSYRQPIEAARQAAFFGSCGSWRAEAVSAREAAVAAREAAVAAREAELWQRQDPLLRKQDANTYASGPPPLSVGDHLHAHGAAETQSSCGSEDPPELTDERPDPRASIASSADEASKPSSLFAFGWSAEDEATLQQVRHRD